MRARTLRAHRNAYAMRGSGWSRLHINSDTDPNLYPDSDGHTAHFHAYGYTYSHANTDGVWADGRSICD
jgi:hypothetical protein